jgi:energy-coupling factor transporter ATP-binding protein EcfA2
MRPATRYDEPFSWWGPGWQERTERSLAELLRDGTIDLERAALLWAALARRQSLAVVAGPSGAGKTTLLTALLAFLPSETRRIYPRGAFETFAFLTDPDAAPRRSALLINEISPHLPVYLWGPAVGRMLAARSAGYMLLATAHAESAVQFVALLTGSPLRVPAAEVAAFDLVVVLEVSREARSGRRVTGLWRMTPAREGIAITEWSVAASALHDISHEALNPPSPDLLTVPPAELTRRIDLLASYRDGHLEALPGVIDIEGV